MKPKLLVLLGAGSSVQLGMPSVSDLNAQMAEWAQMWARMHGFPEDYFGEAWKAIATYYESGPSGPHPIVNFEKTLSDLLALAHWMEPAPWGDTLRQVACRQAAPPYLEFPNPSPSGPGPYGATVLMNDQLTELLRKLAQHIRQKSRALDPTTAAARQYVRLFDNLRSVFDVGVYNLNYDTCALMAQPDAFTGFGDKGTFDPLGIHERTDWGFVYHVHGSVHHTLLGPCAEEIRWQMDLNGDFIDGHPGLSGDKRSDGRSFPITTIVAGGFKLDQLLVEPFHTLHAALVRHIYEADAILIGGYGFGDVHVNRVLRNRLSNRNRPPVMVLERATDTTDPIAFRYERWAHDLADTLKASVNFFVEPGHSSPARPIDLAERNVFEVSPQHHVAIWYGGFAQAETRADSIASWLSGTPDHVLR